MAEICNWDDALKRLDNDTEIMEMMISMFIDEYPVYLKNIYDAFNQQDWPVLTRELHTLKGICSTIGAEKATLLLINAEQVNENKQHSELEPLITSINHEIDALIEFLKTKLAAS